MDSNKISCSFIIPLHNHELSVNEFNNRLVHYLINTGDLLKKVDFSIIYIDDGSDDNTSEIVRSLDKNNSINFQLIEIGQNYGQTTAISAGLYYSDSDIVIIRSADLQDPFNFILKVIENYIEKGNCVILVRQDRKDGVILKILSAIFYSTIKLFYNKMPIGGFDYVLLNRKAVNQLVASYYEGRFLQYDILELPMDKEYIYYTRSKDRARHSSWTFLKRMQYAFKAIFTVLKMGNKIGDINAVLKRVKVYKNDKI